MMYIDQAPLGGNLVNIIKKSASLNNVASPATEQNIAPLITKRLNLGCSGGGEDDDAANKQQKATINGEKHTKTGLLNGNHFATNLANRFKNIHEILNQPAISEFQQNEGKHNVENEEEEDKSQYELYEIEPDQDETTAAGLEETSKTKTNFLTNGFCSFGIDLPATSKPDSFVNSENTTTAKKRTRTAYEAEDDDCEEFMVQLTPIPKSKPSYCTKPPRPPPAVIPIADFLAKSEKCVLNKYLSSSASRNAYERDDPEETEYHLIQSSAGVEHLEPIENQMGIDILSDIWNNLFNRKAKTAGAAPIEQDPTASTSKRKRSFGFIQTKPTQLQFKYRRVDNSFPKIITRALDDDLDNLATNQTAYRVRTGIPTAAAPPPQAFGFEMTQRGDRSSLSQRRSLFEYPQKKVVRNTTYADVEFSDDDDDSSACQMRRLEYTLGTLSAKQCGSQQQRHQPNVRNIPIQLEQPCPRMLMPQLASNTNYLNTFGQPTYADILKQTTPYGGAACHVLSNRLANGSSSNNSSADGASSSRFCNALGKSSSRINSKSIGNSILRQERAKLDHEHYKQLLETLTSRSNHQISSTSRPQSSNLATILNSKKKKLFPKARAPLSSTINIADNDDDDEENSSDDVVVTASSLLNNIARPMKSFKKRTSTQAPIANVDLDYEDDDDIEISEIIELDDDDDDNDKKEKSKRKTANANEVIDLDAKENEHEFDDLPYVEPVNTFREFFQTPILKDDWLQNFNSKWAKKGKARKEEVVKTVEITENVTSERLAFESDLRARLQDIYIVDPELLGVDDFEKPEEEEVPEFPVLNQAFIKAAICGSPDQVLVEKFSLRITRRDIHTLLGLNWLNDEVINFYMNMITERSEEKHESHGYPKVYAMNTFFLPRVLQSGHSAVKRWTRKVDIFDKDLIPVPVHVGGVHWCMALIHLKNKWIRYYDSMGAPNPNVLRTLEQYLKEESLDKRKQPFDTSGFTIECVADVPRQQNGSDCGVFSCMFAEYIARNKPITFEQKHMEYFRHKMIQEIVQGKLLL